MVPDRVALLGLVVLVALAGCGSVLSSGGPSATATETATESPTATEEAVTPTATPTTAGYTTAPPTTTRERTTEFTLSIDPALGWEPPYTVEFKDIGMNLVYVTAWGDTVRENETFMPPLEDGTRYRIRVSDAGNNTRVVGAMEYQRHLDLVELRVG